MRGARPSRGECRRRAARSRRPGRARRQRERARQVEVGVVLPGEADAAEDLDAVLGALLSGGGRERGHAAATHVRAAASALVGRLVVEARAASHTAARACSIATSMWAHLCLTPWNWPIGRPNCSRTLAYSGGGVGGPPCDADGLRRQQGRHERTRVGPAQVGQHAVVGDFDGVGPHVGDRPQGVDTLNRFDLEVGGVDDHPQFARLDGDRQHQYRCLRGGRDSSHLTADHQRIA